MMTGLTTFAIMISRIKIILTKRNGLLFMLLLFVIALTFRLYHLSFGSYNLDEAVHIWFAQQNLSTIISQASNDPNPPLFEMIMHFWIGLFGVSELATRFFMSVMSAATAVALFYFGRKHFSITAGIVAAILFILSDAHNYFAHDTRPYAILGLFVVLSFNHFFTLLKKPNNKSLIWFGVISILIVFLHPTGIFILATQFALAIVIVFKYPRVTVMTFVGTAVAVISFMLWQNYSNYYNLTVQTWIAPPDWDRVVYVLSELYGNVTMVLVFGVIIALNLLFLVFIKEKKQQKILWLVLVSWTILPLFVNFIFSHYKTPVFNLRYNITSTLGAFLAIGVCGQRLIRFKYLLVPVVLLIGFVSFKSIDFHKTSGEDWRCAANYVQTKIDSKTAVFITPWYQYRSFAYYFNRQDFTDYEHTKQLLNQENVYINETDSIMKVKNLFDYNRLLYVLRNEEQTPMLADLKFLHSTYPTIEKFEAQGITIVYFDLQRRLSLLKTMMNDNENNEDNSQNIFNFPLAHSGNFVSVTEINQAFSNGFTLPSDSFPDATNSITAKIWVYCDKQIKNVQIVSSFEECAKPQYESKYINNNDYYGRWKEYTITSVVPQNFKGTYKFYLWNTSKEKVLVDDVSLCFMGDSTNILK